MVLQIGLDRLSRMVRMPLSDRHYTASLAFGLSVCHVSWFRIALVQTWLVILALLHAVVSVVAFGASPAAVFTRA